MKKYLAIFGIMIFCMALGSAYLYAHHHGEKCSEECTEEKKSVQMRREIDRKAPPIDFRMLNKFEGKLELSETQREGIESLRESVRTNMESFRKERIELGKELREELKKEVIDNIRVDQLRDQINDLQAQILDHRIDNIKNLRQILTAEQFEKFEELRAKMRDKGRERAKERHQMKRQKEECDH